ncbi:hypothetical protein [Streptomyces sp. NPDC001315]|uniref:hypothetical protein n=1 Tax=Streptomyces sp. NPDC001315 TaxID=3364562 RepID=UPI0036B143DA
MAEDAQDGGDAGVEAEFVQCAGAGDAEGVGVVGRLEAGLVVPEGGGVGFAAGVVVQGEAVGGRGVSGAGGVLPPKPCAVVDAGEVECAAQQPGAAGFGELVGEELKSAGATVVTTTSQRWSRSRTAAVSAVGSSGRGVTVAWPESR